MIRPTRIECSPHFPIIGLTHGANTRALDGSGVLSRRRRGHSRLFLVVCLHRSVERRVSTGDYSLMPRKRVMVPLGTRYGKLVVESDGGMTLKGEYLWLCRCDCGKTVLRTKGHLRRTVLSSCGCSVREAQIKSGTKRRTHGHYGLEFNGGCSPTMNTWQSMIQRCYYKPHIAYVNYGGRALSVCKEWRDSFETFLQDMGDRPAGTSLDRIDRRFGYFPSNCRWATVRQQMDNRRDVSYRPAFMHPKLIDERDPRVAIYRIWR